MTDEDVIDYRNRIKIQWEEQKLYDYNFTPLMTIQITESTIPEIIEKVHRIGTVAGKVYPIGVTHNSENGVKDFEKMSKVFKKMQEIGMKLLLHGEKPDAFCLNREKEFLSTLNQNQ